MIMMRMNGELNERARENCCNTGMKPQRKVEKISMAVRMTSQHESGMRRLAPDYAGPGPNDVICARGKRALNHPGNRHFRALISSNLENYSAASSNKVKKSLIVSKILDTVRESSPDGGFVKEENGQWFEVGDHIAREKCGQSFRDLLHTQYKSSTKAKLLRRKKMQEVIGSEVEQFIKANGTVARMMDQSNMQHDGSSDKQMQILFDEVNSDLLKQIKHDSPLQFNVSSLQMQQQQQQQTPTTQPVEAFQNDEFDEFDDL